MKLTKAQLIANTVIHVLAPHCTTCLVAGSIRRQVTEVKDIEIVAMPKSKTVVLDLFNQDKRQEMVCDGFVKAVKGLGRVIKGRPDGRYMQIETYMGIVVDLFMPQKHDFWRIYAIRTGSSSFSQLVLARGWVAKGWVGTSDGLRLASECVKNEKTGSWTCVQMNPTIPPVWDSERAFFDWLGISFTEPEKRVISMHEAPAGANSALTIQERIDLGEFTPIPEP